MARLAGLPAPIIERAKQVLTHLEMCASAREPKQVRRKRVRETGLPTAEEPDVTQLDMFNMLDDGLN